jgi:hypothetical protein
LYELADETASRFQEKAIFEFKNQNQRNFWHKKIVEASISCQKEGEAEIALDIRRLSDLYYDEDDFRHRAKLAVFKHDIYILKNRLVLPSASANRPIKDTNGRLNYCYSNVYYYLLIFEDYKKLRVYSYQNDASKEFVLLSPNKKEFSLKYPKIIPDFGEMDLSKKYEAIRTINNAPEFLAFFKEQTIDWLIGFEDTEIRFFEFIKSLEQIVSLSNADYEVFLKKFNFDKFKENFRKERDEYFFRIREILTSLLNKVVSIPVSISAAALAFYNVSSDWLASSLIILGYVIASIFTSWLIRGLHEDANLIEKDFYYDTESLKEFSSNKLNQVTRKEIDKVSKKLSQLKRYIYAIQVFLVFSSVVAILVYLFAILKFSIACGILSAIALADIQFIFCFFNLEGGGLVNESRS